MGKGILRTAKITFLVNTNPARRLAMKVGSIKFDSANNSVVMMKTAQKTPFPLRRSRAGDQKSTPATKIPAITRLMRAVKVNEEFISSWGFSARGRKRISEESKPTRLNMATRLAADIVAEL